MNMPQDNHDLLGEQLMDSRLFPVFTILNKVAVYVLCKPSCEAIQFLGRYLGVDYAKLCFPTLRSQHTFSQRGTPVFHPTEAKQYASSPS